MGNLLFLLLNPFRKGATAAPLQGHRLALFAALLLPAPCRRLLRHCAYPSFRSWDSRGLSPFGSVAALRHADLLCGALASSSNGQGPVTSVRCRTVPTPFAWGSLPPGGRWGCVGNQENRGCQGEGTPPDGASALTASFRPWTSRPSSRRPSPISSPLFLLGTGSSALYAPSYCSQQVG